MIIPSKRDYAVTQRSINIQVRNFTFVMKKIGTFWFIIMDEHENVYTRMSKLVGEEQADRELIF